MKKNIIYIFICLCFSDNFLPEDNADVNYTQIFFMWPQIENAENYEKRDKVVDLKEIDFNRVAGSQTMHVKS